MVVRMIAIVSLLLVAACTSAGKNEESSCMPARGMGVHGVTTHCERTAGVSSAKIAAVFERKTLGEGGA